MKKTLLFCLIAISYFSASSQTIEIDDYTWYIHSYGVNGNITDKPFSPEMTIQLDFDLSNNVLMSDLCCGGNFQLDINVDSNNSTFQGSNFTNTTTNCTETANTSFADLVHDFFENNVNSDFTYDITEENFLTVKLEITTIAGEKLILYNTPHLDRDSIIFSEDIEWYLTGLNINGTSVNFPPGIQEVDKVTATFKHDGSFETTVCNQLTASFTYNGQKLFFNCGNINIPTNNCSSSIDENFQDTYFNFFNNHSNEQLDVEIYLIEFIENGPCDAEYQIMINYPSDDYLIFSDCPYSLATEKSHLQQLSFYPNPATETVFIENNKQEINKLQVIDISGKKLKTFKNVKNQVDVSELPSGVYFFKIYSEGNTTIKKVIKE